MRSWCRARMPAVAITLLVSMAALGLPHAGGAGHDAEFAVVVAHDASAHRIEAPDGSAADHGVHCLVCHWVRSFRPAAEEAYTASPAIDIHAPGQTETTPPRRTARYFQPPLRSPPALSLS